MTKGLGERGRKRVEVKPPVVNELFKSTEQDSPEHESQPLTEYAPAKVGRPKGEQTVQKSFTLPIELNRRLRRFAFEHECKEVDIVRRALDDFFNTHEKI